MHVTHCSFSLNGDSTERKTKGCHDRDQDFSDLSRTHGREALTYISTEVLLELHHLVAPTSLLAPATASRSLRGFVH